MVRAKIINESIKLYICGVQARVGNRYGAIKRYMRGLNRAALEVHIFSGAWNNAANVWGKSSSKYDFEETMLSDFNSLIEAVKKQCPSARVIVMRPHVLFTAQQAGYEEIRNNQGRGPRNSYNRESPFSIMQEV